MKKRVLVALSGGVDSAVAAALLLEKGYEVAGATMRLDPNSPDDATRDAREVAEKLGIPFYEFDLRDRFVQEVIEPFCDRYLEGQTPNPCVLCNRTVKFGAFWEKAKALGFEFMATGHYARVTQDETGFHLLRADSAKDQTYVLYSLTQAVLSHLLLPLGELPDKDTVRRIAAERGLAAADRPDSQEICFIPDQDYARFILERRQADIPEGDFVDPQGRVLGRHKGLIHYTIGQRKGLGIALGERRFVVTLDAANNRVVLGDDQDCFAGALEAGELNFLAGETPECPCRLTAKVRYSAQDQPITLTVRGDKALVVFDTPERAVTPGQAVVFYRGDELIGGGTILRKTEEII